jgi:riboflavin synthase alpha subunit
MSDYQDSARAAFIETRDFLGGLTLTGPNGLTAEVMAGSFPESQTLHDARYDSKIPARVTMLQEDFTRLAIVDRGKVGVAGLSLTVIVIDPDPADPLVDLTLTKFS